MTRREGRRGKRLVRGGLKRALGAFCRKMGREAKQGEVGLVVGDEYFAIREFGVE